MRPERSGANFLEPEDADSDTEIAAQNSSNADLKYDSEFYSLDLLAEASPK